MEYVFSHIESKWKQQWAADALYKVSEDYSKPKYYVLDMFPYPSGAGLHVGHPLGYVATDIFSRYKRLNGFNVLHTMGFDAFGLPAEQYAIETGTHPAITTKKNIEYYREQLNKIGFCYDWSREVITADPAFYKWTQWIFIQLFKSWYNPFLNKAEEIETLIAIFENEGSKQLVEKGIFDIVFTADEWKNKTEKEQQEILMQFRLAYLDHADIWWCETLGTVLANDEVKDGVSERGGHPVERIRMRQWFLRITAYADRLLDGLNTLDWSDSMKEMQRNWIGRSEGASVNFNVSDSKYSIEVFTTRPDTIYGATFMVLAPEHDLVDEITTDEFKSEVNTYLDYVKTRSERDRQAEVKKVTGQFTGAFAINPFTENKIPIYIAEYVLAGYGTGAIMAVPSNDERDFAFAEKFSLPVVEVVDQSAYPNADKQDKVGVIINSEMLNGLEVKEAISTMIFAIAKKNIGKRKINYRLRDAGFSRQRYWGEPFPVIYKNEIPYVLNENELPLELPEVVSYKPGGNAQSPLAALTDWVNPDNTFIRETDTMPGYAGSSWYFLRYMDPKNPDRFVGEAAENYWQNVDLYVGGTEHAVGHLLYSRMWQKFLFDRNLVSKDEPFKKLVNQGMIQGRSSLVYRVAGTNTFISAGIKENYETSPLHVDIKMVDDDILNIEAFKQWRSDLTEAEFILEDGIYKCGWEIDKMSKRYHNVVNPDDVIAEYGADCFRMYEMFLGPLEASKPWDTKGISGVAGFLRKLWRLFYDDNGQLKLSETEPDKDALKALHKCIKKVGDDIERLSFNTAVSACMIAVNSFQDLKCSNKNILKDFLVIVAPFAPFITEELWHASGEKESIHIATWPKFNPDYLVENTFVYPVSINGKVRTTLELPLTMQKEEIEQSVLALESILKWTEGKTPKKVIVVPGKIVNVVI
ncbi:MAG: leucine--tRNA ligase [Chitinophagales bacterium]|nr:leucine--tRNA ligase [Bacteroidota bacterium]MBP7400088.1 leucine--tRNA ligase [Chitinophagales bacterium]MBK8680562.1 leucine--tRNA ligase [Bacteroidota bacterium]MBP8752673.1 leucine--tRNA ligase [Chitinophagales bacterium]MBP9188527.1 leucine--tRNA ligase [Chitinophagales bacterium]